MNVAFYEKIWMWAAGLLIVAFLTTLVAGLAGGALQPPSHVETINPRAVDADARFATPGVQIEDGRVTVTVVARLFAFTPDEIRAPVNRPVTFRITSPDVTHGFQIVATNANTMVVPGYVSQFTTTFAAPGEYLIVCNEYCGLNHHGMYAKLIVEGAP